MKERVERVKIRKTQWEFDCKFKKGKMIKRRARKKRGKGGGRPNQGKKLKLN
jgi:hypothetical protein